jgi:hypothetical protein
MLGPSLTLLPMMKYPKGGQGSGLYKLGLHHTYGVDRGSVEGNTNKLEHKIIAYTNHNRTSPLNFLLRHILVIQMISVRSEGGQVPGLNKPLTH